jgi:hypothetical protein
MFIRWLWRVVVLFLGRKAWDTYRRRRARSTA